MVGFVMFVISIFLVAGLVFLLGMSIGQEIEKNSFKEIAVNMGYAEWADEDRTYVNWLSSRKIALKYRREQYAAKKSESK